MPGSDLKLILALDFPSGGTLLMAEDAIHAKEIANVFQKDGHRAVAIGRYVRTTAVMNAKGDAQTTDA